MTSTKYEDAVKALESLFQFAITLSNNTQGRIVETRREEVASHLFTKICLHVSSILRLTPKSSYHDPQSKSEIWDYTSVAVLTRALMEAYYTFYYLVIDEIDESEIDFRFLLWDFHSENRRLEQLRLIGSKHPDLHELEKNAEALRNQLEQNPQFRSLEKDLKKKVLKGDVPLLLSNIKIAEKAGISRNYQKVTYIYLSSYIHSYPFAISQIAALKGDTEKILELNKPILGYCLGHLCFSIRDFIKVVPDQQVYLVESVKDLINEWEYIFGNIYK